MKLPQKQLLFTYTMSKLRDAHSRNISKVSLQPELSSSQKCTKN